MLEVRPVEDNILLFTLNLVQIAEVVGTHKILENFTPSYSENLNSEKMFL